MPFESVLPLSFPAWDVDCGWPQTVAASGATAAVVSTTAKCQAFRLSNPGGQSAQTYMTSIVSSHNDPDWAVHNGLRCISPQTTFNGSTFFFGDACTILGPFDSEGFVASGAWLSGVSVIPYQRVYIDDLMVAFASPVMAGISIGSTIVGFTVDGGQAQTQVHANRGFCYGLRPDGAGGVEYFNTLSGVLQESVPIVWPTADFTKYVKVTVEHIMASAVGPAQVRFFLNGVPVLTRAWGAGSTLPDLTVPAARHMRRFFGGESGEPADSMFFTMFRSRIGRYTVDGTELS